MLKGASPEPVESNSVNTKKPADIAAGGLI